MADRPPSPQRRTGPPDGICHAAPGPEGPSYSDNFASDGELSNGNVGKKRDSFSLPPSLKPWRTGRTAGIGGKAMFGVDFERTTGFRLGGKYRCGQGGGQWNAD